MFVSTTNTFIDSNNKFANTVNVITDRSNL